MSGEAQKLSTEPGRTGVSVHRGIISLTTDLRTGGNASEWFQPSGERKDPFVYTRLEGNGGGKDGWKSPGDNTRAGLESGVINTPLTVHPAALAKDTARITKMLASANGLKFATHTLENAAVAAAMETHWAKKKGDSPTLWQAIGKEALIAGAVTADTIAQTAVAGTGVHFEPYKSRGVLKKTGNLWSIAGQGGEIDTTQYEDGTQVNDAKRVRRNTKDDSPFPGVLTASNTDWLKNFNLVPFEIVSIIPDQQEKWYLYFQANLDSFDDDYSGNWENQQYIGRGDMMYAYTGFTRRINFSFKAVARKQEDLEPLYKQLNALAAMTAPNYDQNGSFMRGTLASVTIGDLLKNQKGFFTSIKLSWKQDYPWSIGKDTGGKETIKVPHLLDVSVGFTPIQSFNATSRPELASSEKSYFGVK